MLQLSQALLANMDMRKLLGAISASIGEMIPHDAATLALYDEAKGELVAQFLDGRCGAECSGVRCVCRWRGRQRDGRSGRGSRWCWRI